jgi:hypothetical protein
MDWKDFVTRAHLEAANLRRDYRQRMLDSQTASRSSAADAGVEKAQAEADFRLASDRLAKELTERERRRQDPNLHDTARYYAALVQAHGAVVALSSFCIFLAYTWLSSHAADVWDDTGLPLGYEDSSLTVAVETGVQF